MLIDCLKEFPDTATFRVVERRVDRVGFGVTYRIVYRKQARVVADRLAARLTSIAALNCTYASQAESIGTNHIDRAFDITL